MIDTATLADEEERKRLQATRITPRAWEYLPKELYFLHLFSGRRRAFDLQCYLDLCAAPEGVCLFTVSVDVQISASKCNLRDAAQQERWIQLILAGLAGGLVAGPPCETWTKARAVQTESKANFQGP